MHTQQTNPLLAGPAYVPIDTLDTEQSPLTNNEDMPSAGEKDAALASPTPTAPALTKEELLDQVIRYIARTYVRKDGRYYLVTDPSEKYSMEDVARSLAIQLPQVFRSEQLTPELIQEARRVTMNQKHSDPERTIPIWNGKSECMPGEFGSFVHDQGLASINTWLCPDYRLMPNPEPSTYHLDAFLKRVMPHETDRRWFKDWLAWCFQNEAEKPGWAVFLYSRNKGTGKSTLLQLMSKLFGEGNTINCNSVDSVTGRFNAPVFEKKSSRSKRSS